MLETKLVFFLHTQVGNNFKAWLKIKRDALRQDPEDKRFELSEPNLKNVPQIGC